MLFAGWEVRIVKNCDRGLENAAQGRRQASSQTKKTHASVTVTVVRDRKIRTALRTNRIAGFVTVPAWKIISLAPF